MEYNDLFRPAHKRCMSAHPSQVRLVQTNTTIHFIYGGFTAVVLRVERIPAYMCDACRHQWFSHVTDETDFLKYFDSKEIMPHSGPGPVFLTALFEETPDTDS